MIVKLVRGGAMQRMVDCRHITRKDPEDGVIEIECSPGPSLKLPDDGDTVYVMNDLGRTVDTIRLASEEARQTA